MRRYPPQEVSKEEGAPEIQRLGSAGTGVYIVVIRRNLELISNEI